MLFRSHTVTQQGPLITISFQTAEGLEAGKTRVRFKDVDVGLVEAIELSPDLRRVQVRARLAGSVADYLNDNTRFWVARPRLSVTQVSGLGTLLGGSELGLSREAEAALGPAEVEERLAAARARLHEAGAHYVVRSIAGLPGAVTDIERRLSCGERAVAAAGAEGRGR